MLRMVISQKKVIKKPKKNWNVLLNQFGKNEDEKHFQTPSIFTVILFHHKIPCTHINFFKWVSKKIRDNLCFVYFAMWLVQKTRVTLSTNQIQN